MRHLPLALLVLTLFAPTTLRAQSDPASAANEVEVWTGGGHGLNGSTSSTGVWNVGLRYGWLLTDPAGPGFLRGRFEFGVDAVPVFLVVQKTGTAYGFGLNPFALKWDFTSNRRIVPYLELNGGTLFTDNRTPPGTSHVNFTSSGAIGAHFVRSRFTWSAELRFMHISNAGLVSPNPGINTLQIRLGFSHFSRSK